MKRMKNFLPWRRPWIIGGMCLVGASAYYIYKLHQHHHLTHQYTLAVAIIAASAGQARKGQDQQDEDDETRYRYRHAFFTHFWEERLRASQQNFKFIHVTGTKGKGTVCELIRCGLVAHGEKVGTFTSPHLHSVRERIRIGDQCISRKAFVRLWQIVQDALEKDPTAPRWVNFFDKVLALALAHFVEEKVEYIILEVGIGGRYDPTNFITLPAVTVITSISLDHIELLGDTVEKIAWQKAGIFKRGSPALTSASQTIAWQQAGIFERGSPALTTASQTPGVIKALQDEVSKVGAQQPLLLVGKEASSPNGSTLKARKTKKVLPFAKFAHEDNIALAAQALRILLRHQHRQQQQSHPSALPSASPTYEAQTVTSVLEEENEEDVYKGWENAFWPARFEVLEGTIDFSPSPSVSSNPTTAITAKIQLPRPDVSARARSNLNHHQQQQETVLTIIFDVAHNTDSIAKVLQEVKQRFAGRPIYMVFGTGADKDQKGMLEILCPQVHQLVLCQANHPRAVPIQTLASFIATQYQTILLPTTASATAVTQATVARESINGKKAQGIRESNGDRDTTIRPEEGLERALMEVQPRRRSMDEGSSAEGGDEATAAGKGGGGRENGSKNGIILVCGSFFVVAAARAHLAKLAPHLFRPGDWAFEQDPPIVYDANNDEGMMIHLTNIIERTKQSLIM